MDVLDSIIGSFDVVDQKVIPCSTKNSILSHLLHCPIAHPGHKQTQGIEWLPFDALCLLVPGMYLLTSL